MLGLVRQGRGGDGAGVGGCGGGARGARGAEGGLEGAHGLGGGAEGGEGGGEAVGAGGHFGCLVVWLVLGGRSLLRVSRGESERESERSGQIQLSIVESKVGWFRGGEWVVRLTWKECYNDVVGNVRALFRVGLLVAQV